MGEQSETESDSAHALACNAFRIGRGTVVEGKSWGILFVPRLLTAKPNAGTQAFGDLQLELDSVMARHKRRRRPLGRANTCARTCEEQKISGGMELAGGNLRLRVCPWLLTPSKREKQIWTCKASYRLRGICDVPTRWIIYRLRSQVNRQIGLSAANKLSGSVARNVSGFEESHECAEKPNRIATGDSYEHSSHR